jgi:hypothetical protein
MINIGISIPTELTANATVLFSITQTNKGLEQPCWTDLMNPDECNPLVVGLDLSAAFTNISFDANIEVDMLSCGPQAPEDCQDISVADLATMVINNQTFIAVATALKPMQYIEVTEMKVSFDQMTNFGYYIHDGGEFVNGIGNKILDISQEEVNKKGNLYTKITGHLSELMNDFINKQIQNKAQTLYGNSCY